MRCLGCLSSNKLLDFKSIGSKIDKQAMVASSMRSMSSFAVNPLSRHKNEKASGNVYFNTDLSVDCSGQLTHNVA